MEWSEEYMAGSYSVWAVAPSVYPGLQAAKQHLRESFGGPDLEAHVTVLGGINGPLHDAAETSTISSSSHLWNSWSWPWSVRFVRGFHSSGKANREAKRAFELESQGTQRTFHT